MRKNDIIIWIIQIMISFIKIYSNNDIIYLLLLFYALYDQQ